MVQRSVRISCFLVLAVGFLACTDQGAIIKKAWEALEGEYSGSLSKLKGDFTALQDKVSALGSLQGLAGDVPALAKDLQGSLSGLASVIPGLEGQLSDAKAKASAAIAGGKWQELKDLSGTLKSTLGDGLTKSLASLASAQGLFSKLESAVATAKEQKGSAPNLDELAYSVGKADFSDIDFKPGSSEFSFTNPASKATLDKLVTFAKTCPELRLNLIGHTSKDGSAEGNQKISGARALSVKSYLLKAGVPKAVVVGTSGKGSSSTLVDEPEAGSEAAKAIAPEELAKIRAKNRRIEVEVVTACSRK